MPALLFVTVIASVTVGILAAYAVVVGIFASFGRATHSQPEAERPRLVLVPSQNHASGD